MSVRMALAKLSACAAGGALIGGGAVHVAEGQKARTMFAKKVAVAKKRVRYAARPTRVRRVVTRTTTTCAPATVTVSSQAAPVPVPAVYSGGGGGVAPAVLGGGFVGGGGGFGGGFFGGGGNGGGGGNIVLAGTNVDIKNSNSNHNSNHQHQNQHQGQSSTTSSSSSYGSSSKGWSTSSGWSTSGGHHGGSSGKPTPVPAPPMVLLFGVAAAALVARKRLAKPVAA